MAGGCSYYVSSKRRFHIAEVELERPFPLTGQCTPPGHLELLFVLDIFWRIVKGRCHLAVVQTGTGRKTDQRQM